MKVKLIECQFTTLTPCFAHGPDTSVPLLQGPTIKGSLREFGRRLGMKVDALFGDVPTNRHDKPTKGSLIVRITSVTKVLDTVPTMAHKPRPKASAFMPASVWSLTILGPEAERADVKLLVDCWLAFGTVGLKKTRASGSVWPVTGFSSDVWDALRCKLPGYTIRIIGSADNSEDLRYTCNDTLHENAFASAGFVMGGVGASVQRRKESEVVFKVAKFEDGFSLVMLHKRNIDNVVEKAAVILEKSSKLIGKWMRQTNS